MTYPPTTSNVTSYLLKIINFFCWYVPFCIDGTTEYQTYKFSGFLHIAIRLKIKNSFRTAQMFYLIFCKQNAPTKYKYVFEHIFSYTLSGIETSVSANGRTLRFR